MYGLFHYPTTRSTVAEQIEALKNSGDQNWVEAARTENIVKLLENQKIDIKTVQSFDFEDILALSHDNIYSLVFDNKLSIDGLKKLTLDQVTTLAHVNSEESKNEILNQVMPSVGYLSI